MGDGAPQFLSLDRHRDRAAARPPWLRRAALAALALLAGLGLANVFGQRPQTDIRATPAVALKVYSPKRLRGGLFYESRFTIDARQELENATLILDPGWLEGMTLNTLEPAPIAEASRDGRLVLELGRVPAGRTHRFFLHFQVNPTNLGRRSQDVELQDAGRPLTYVRRTVTVFP